MQSFPHFASEDEPAGVPPAGRKTPSGEPRPFRDEATQRASRCARKDARPWPYCNAPYARVLRGFTALNHGVVLGAMAPTGHGSWHPWLTVISFDLAECRISAIPARVPWKTANFLEFPGTLLYQGALHDTLSSGSISELRHAQSECPGRRYPISTPSAPRAGHQSLPFRFRAVGARPGCRYPWPLHLFVPG